MAIIDVARWNAVPGVFAWKFPNDQLSTWTRLIVSESQEAVLIKEGRAIGPFGPGVHVLDTQNYPVLTSFVKIVTGGVTPFTAEVWFVAKTFKLDIRWGTASAMQMEDPKYHIILPVRAFGQYGLTVVDTPKFLTKLVGTLPAFVERTLIDYFRGIILTQTKDLIASYLTEKGVSVLQINAHLNEISALLESQISGKLEEYGMQMVNFTVNSISTDEKDPAVARLRQALARKAEMDIIGYNYQQQRSFDTMEAAAGNQGAGGVIQTGIGMGMGMGMGVPMGNSMSGMMGNLQTQPGAALCPACHAALPAGAVFCPGCGQKIGGAAPTGGAFCPGCGKPIGAASLFCQFCGTKVK